MKNLSMRLVRPAASSKNIVDGYDAVPASGHGHARTRQSVGLWLLENHTAEYCAPTFAPVA